MALHDIVYLGHRHSSTIIKQSYDNHNRPRGGRKKEKKNKYHTLSSHAARNASLRVRQVRVTVKFHTHRPCCCAARVPYAGTVFSRHSLTLTSAHETGRMTVRGIRRAKREVAKVPYRRVIKNCSFIDPPPIHPPAQFSWYDRFIAQ